MTKPTIAASALLLALACAPKPRLALAQAYPVFKEPTLGATLAAPPRRVTLSFDGPIQKVYSDIEVLNDDYDNQATGPASLAEDGRTLSVTLKPLKPGSYFVHWRALAVDGYRTHGGYTFTVGKGGS